MNTRISRRSAAVLSAAALATAATLAAAPAHAATDAFTEETTYGFFYDNLLFGDGDPRYLVIAGGTLTDFCVAGGPFAAAPGSAVAHVRVSGQPGVDGAYTQRFVVRGVMELYENEGMAAPDYIAHHCAVWDATGEIPEPYAAGAGTVKSSTEIEWADGVESGSTENTSRGQLRTADGDLLVVWAEAQVTIAPVEAVDFVGFRILNR